MKLIWSPVTASKAYMDTVKRASKSPNYPGEAEFLSAMAAGHNAKLIVEVRQNMTATTVGGGIATSIGLAVAARHTRGRHVCMVPDEDSRRDYVNAMQDINAPLPEMMVGEPERMVDALDGVEFLVVQGRCSSEIFRRAKVSYRGAILVHKGEGKMVNSIQIDTQYSDRISDDKNSKTIVKSRFCWCGIVSNNLRIVKSLSLPLENGMLEIVYVAKNDGKTLKSSRGEKRWIRHIDVQSGEEHAFRR